MVFGCYRVYLMDWHGGVDDLRLYDFLVHDWLDGFMYLGFSYCYVSEILAYHGDVGALPWLLELETLYASYHVW